MGILDFLTGKAQADAARDAARIQANFAREGRDRAQETVNFNIDDFRTALDDALKEYRSGREDITQGLTSATGVLDRGRTDALSALAGAAGGYTPYTQAGTGALGSLLAHLGLSGPEAATAARSNFMATPGYDWRMGQGVQALDRSAAAKGGLYSGAQGKALTQFGQGLASDEYGRYMDRLSSMANLGLQGASGQAGLAGQQAGTLSNFANMGANAALGSAGQLSNLYNNMAAARLGTASNIGNTRMQGLNQWIGQNTNVGQAEAGGHLAAAQAQGQGLMNMINAGLGLGKLISGWGLPTRF